MLYSSRKHETAPTGELYAVVDKTQVNTNNKAPSPEPATYQDPATIQRETAPTGDLYTIPDKNVAKQVYHTHTCTHTYYLYMVLMYTVHVHNGCFVNRIITLSLHFLYHYYAPFFIHSCSLIIVMLIRLLQGCHSIVLGM